MPTPDAIATLRTARRALDMERWDAAREVLRPMLAANAGLAEGWLLLARVEAADGKGDAAAEAFARCIALVPQEPVVWMEYALARAAEGRGGEVVKLARRAAVPQALLAMVQEAARGQGVRARGSGGATKAEMAALARTSGLRQAEALAAPLLRSKPGAVVWGVLAQARLDGGQAASAAEAFRQGLRLEPYATDLRTGLVAALGRAGDAVGALAEARTAARHAPLAADPLLLSGRAALTVGLGDRALAVAGTGLARHPRDGRFLLLAAEAALTAGRPVEAVAFARKAGGHLLLARCLEAAGKVDEALAAYDAAVAAGPRDANALLGRGQLRQTLGQVGEAEADLRAAVAIAPMQGVAERALAYGGRLRPDDPLVAGMRAALNGNELSHAARRSMDYAMARVLQKQEPEVAAGHLATANGSMLAAYPWEPQRRDMAADWARLRDAVEPGATSECDAAPVFVTGLPRSGTTLVEAILGAHPAMTAGGELAVLRRVLPQFGDGALTSGKLTEVGEAYVAAARGKLPDGAERWTDKSIYSFEEIGAIRLILPQARIVVVERDPRDVGLSIWRNHFREGTHRYAASQRGIAEQIGLAREAVAFWAETLPGAFGTVSYEALLDDPEGQSRRLLELAGLDWDARVLAFHEHAGPVRTLSFDQVRQPLYRTSKGGWRESAAEIAELIDALGELGLLPD